MGRDAEGRFRIKIQSPPVEGKANKRLIMFISKVTGVSKSGIRIVTGERARDKLLEIAGDETAIISKLERET